MVVLKRRLGVQADTGKSSTADRIHTLRARDVTR
jgi:hypothetical protein